ncbi:hypothetical protein LguiB_032939 [Lonicera macranthoides]
MGTDASITTSGVHNAGTIDNECNLIAKYDDMQSVTALDVGAGHIILQSVADPRLPQLHGGPNEVVNQDNRSLFEKAGSREDFKYPSIPVVLRESTSIQEYTIKRYNPSQDMHAKAKEPGNEDVAVKILYCGVCHSDLHTAKNEWGFTNYPVVPGHEIVGQVTKVGSNVTKFRVGDRVGVGVIGAPARHVMPANKIWRITAPK